MGKVRGHLRSRKEGLQLGFTKPSNLKHKRNPSARVNICAGIMGGQVKLWHQLPQQWNRKISADLYRGPIKKTVTANSGVTLSLRP